MVIKAIGLGAPVTLTVHGGGEMDVTALKAVFALAGSALKAPWKLAEQEPADMALVVMDEHPEAGRLWQESRERFPVERLIAYVGDETPGEWHWRLPRRGAGRVPRLRDLALLLNEITERWAAAAPESAEPTSAVESREDLFDPEVFVPESRLLGLLQQAMLNGTAYRISLEGGPEVHIAPVHDAFLSSGAVEALLPLCTAECRHLLVEPIDAAKVFPRLLEQGHRKRSLLELLWFAALTGSQGRLLAGHAADTPVHLRQWPDFARLPYYSEYQELALYMDRQAATLTDIAEATGFPLGQVIDFHNACAAMGLMEHGLAATERLRKRSLCRECLSNAFHTLATKGRLQRTVKVLITGSVGAGKTTSILESSDTMPVLTETRPSDQVADQKATTTVAMDYGEVALSCGVKVQLMGTPGQRRFEFMGQILARNAWGLVVLIDHSAPAPLDDLRYYLKLYREFLPTLNLAVALTRHEHDPAASLEPYGAVLGEHGIPYLLDFFDPRQASAVFDLLTRMAKGFVSG